MRGVSKDTITDVEEMEEGEKSDKGKNVNWKAKEGR